MHVINKAIIRKQFFLAVNVHIYASLYRGLSNDLAASVPNV